MPLPLPSVVSNVGPGGPLVTSLAGMNALQKAMSENQIENVKAQYAPTTVMADAASKLAYARLMGPQFLSKLMGNSDILANLSPEQRNQALQMVYAAGSGQGTGNNAFNNLLNNPPQASNNSLSGWLIDRFKNMIGDQGSQQSQPTNAFANQPTINPGRVTPVNLNNLNLPSRNPSIETPQNNTSSNPNTFAENVGSYQGIKAEGSEAGKLRAEAINDLGDTVFNGQTKQATINNLSNIVSSPEFEKMRQTPILGKHELSFYQRYGTPAQQNLVGQFITLSGNIIRDASQDFKGSFRKGEQQLLQDMKVNPGDTFDAARGKIEQLSLLNQMITQRARLTGQYMSQNHMSKLQAEDLADKQINADGMRNQIHNQLNPRPTDEDIDFMAQKYKTTPDEIRKRLKAKGVM